MVTPIKPNGAVKNTRKTREKLCNCNMSKVSTANMNNGKPAPTEAPPLADSSTAPPVANLTPMGN